MTTNTALRGRHLAITLFAVALGEPGVDGAPNILGSLIRDGYVSAGTHGITPRGAQALITWFDFEGDQHPEPVRTELAQWVMQARNLPLITSRPALPTVLCDSCEGETPATRELNYQIRPGTRDAAGRSLAVCDLAACKAIARSYIDKVGDYIETLRYDGRPEA